MLVIRIVKGSLGQSGWDSFADARQEVRRVHEPMFGFTNVLFYQCFAMFGFTNVCNAWFYQCFAMFGFIACLRGCLRTNLEATDSIALLWVSQRSNRINETNNICHSSSETDYLLKYSAKCYFRFGILLYILRVIELTLFAQSCVPDQLLVFLTKG